MVAAHGRDEFAETLRRYDRAMNRLVDGPRGRSRGHVPAMTRQASPAPGSVSNAVGPKAMLAAGTARAHRLESYLTRRRRGSSLRRDRHAEGMAVTERSD
jgi:hypothetical protein